MFSPKSIRTIVAFLISVLFLWLAIRGVNLREAVENVGKFNKLLMLIALMVWWFGYGLRGLRWQIFLNNLSTVKWLDSFRVLVVGFAVNNVLPLRAGEFVRAYLLHRVENKISTSSSFATVAGERVFDGIAVVLLTIIGATSLALPSWGVQAIRLGVLIFTGAFFSFLLSVFYTAQVEKVITYLTSFLPSNWANRIKSIFQRFIEGLGVLKSKKLIFVLLVYSLFIWTLEVCFYYLSSLSFGINLSFLNAAFLMGILNLGVMVPAGPGGVGTFEFIAVASLGLFGISESLAFSYGVVVHVLENVSVIVVGFYYFWRMGFPLDKIKDQKAKIKIAIQNSKIFKDTER